jgi:hypothetical protein
MFSWIPARDHAKSKSGDVTKVLTELQGSTEKDDRIHGVTTGRRGWKEAKKKRDLGSRAKCTSLGGGGGALTGQIGGQANQRVSIF